MWLSIALAAQQAADNGGSLVPLYYIVSIGAVIVTAIWALKKYNDREREKWVKRGKQEQDLSDRLEGVIESNTQLRTSVDKLTQRMDGFTSNVNGQLNGHDRRIEKLEDYAVYGTAPYRRTNPPGKS